MNLLYAVILVCWPDRCISLRDQLGPYPTREACEGRLRAMESVATAAFAGVPSVTMLSSCATVEDLRKVLPDLSFGDSST